MLRPSRTLCCAIFIVVLWDLACPQVASPVSGESASSTAETAPDPGLDGPVALPNFKIVSPGIYRSAQPNRQGLADLAEGNFPDAPTDLFGQPEGMRTILNLRNINGPDAPVINQEQQLVASFGMTDLLISLDGTPPFQSVNQAISILTDAPRQPILVHCRDGKDRTSYVVAAYRVFVERMDVDQAVAEAHSFGCCKAGYQDLKTFLLDYLNYRSGNP